MAKKSAATIKNIFVDRVLIIGALLASTAYIVRGTWASMFLEAGAIVLGIIWSYRAIVTNPSRDFRLAASLVLMLLGCLLAFYMGSAQKIF